MSLGKTGSNCWIMRSCCIPEPTAVVALPSPSSPPPPQAICVHHARARARSFYEKLPLQERKFLREQRTSASFRKNVRSAFLQPEICEPRKVGQFAPSHPARHHFHFPPTAPIIHDDHFGKLNCVTNFFTRSLEALAGGTVYALRPRGGSLREGGVSLLCIYKTEDAATSICG